MIFGQKRGVAVYLKELADLDKITYTLIPTGTRLSFVPVNILRGLLHLRPPIPGSRNRLQGSHG